MSKRNAERDNCASLSVCVYVCVGDQVQVAYPIADEWSMEEKATNTTGEQSKEGPPPPTDVVASCRQTDRHLTDLCVNTSISLCGVCVCVWLQQVLIEVHVLGINKQKVVDLNKELLSAFLNNG